jgi:hypothetical protein
LFEIERCGIRDIASGVVRNDCDVITHLVLIRITQEWIERIAHRDVGRPRIAPVRAVGIEELRIGVVPGVSRVQPNGIYASIRRDRKRAEPVPFAVINRIVVDAARGAERLSAVRAAHKHHVGSGAEAGRLHARNHVNIVISTGARTVHR